MNEQAKLLAELATKLIIHGYKRHNGMQVITETVTAKEAVDIAAEVIGRSRATDIPYRSSND